MRTQEANLRTRSIRIAVLRALGLLALVVAAPAALAEHDARDVSESRTAAPDGRVKIESIAGTLDVNGWSEDRVEVTGRLDTRANLVVESGAEGVTVKVEWPKKIHNFWSGKVVCDLHVKVPAQGSVEVEVVSSETVIAGVSGGVEVQAVSGGVKVSGDSRRVRAEVVSGDLEVTSSGGRVSAEAVSGTVVVRSPGGEVEASTVSGNVSVFGGPFDRLKMEAVSGNAEFAGALSPEADVKVSTHSGDVDFGLQGEPKGEYDVSTFSGSIRSEFGGKSHRAGEYAPGEEYHYDAGGAGPKVSIDAFSGTVRLRRL